MGKYIICGGEKLFGQIDIQGSKNAVLPLYAASLLTKEKVIIHNVPILNDVENMGKILESLNVKINMREKSVEIDSADIISNNITSEYVKNLRSSIFLLGSVLGRTHKAKVSYPGGCDIGLRPIDIHIKVLRDLGVKIEEKGGFIECDGTNMIAKEICLDYPSVGATENVLLASVLLKGRTIIHNSAREPEIVELEKFLNSMGAKIKGAGTSTIYVEGVRILHGTEYTVSADRIVTGTYILAGLMCGGEMVINGANKGEVNALINKFDKTSCVIRADGGKIVVTRKGRIHSPEKVITQPYPGFPTDLQAPFCVYASIADGMCVLTESIFENRFRHVPELNKMGANIMIQDRVAVIKGMQNLVGTEVKAQDLRGGASLVLAGLVAEGITLVDDIYHIERGYEKIEEVLSSLGAKIVRI